MALTVKNFAGQVAIKEPQTAGSMTIYPLFFEEKRGTGADPSAQKEHKPLEYLLLEEALDSGSFEIGEVSESGDVNTVIIHNMTGKPVLILDGEEILGAKQNRMVNATILVASGKKTEVPVSCVEQGRWQYSSEKFGKSDSFGYSSLRRQKAEQVSRSLRSEMRFAADQGAIWEEIDRTQGRMNTHSPTGALHETYRRHEEELEKMIEGLVPLPGQLGVAVYIKNSFVCIDLFDQPGTLEKLWTRLLKSYAIEALDTGGRRDGATGPEPEKIIEAIDRSEYMTYPSVGLGKDLRLNAPEIVGAGLLVDEQIVHLSVFKTEENERRGNIGSPRRRRHNLG